MNIRGMELPDLEDVSRLESESFSRPWTRQMIYQDFAFNRKARFRVAEVDNEVIGYVGTWRQEDEIHITTLAVKPAHRRRGVATRLLKTVLKSDPHDREVTLEVRVSNRAAQKLYRSLGFKRIGRRPQYYSDNREDALIMSYRPSPQESKQHGDTPRRQKRSR